MTENNGTMTAEDARLEILPSGVRIVRLEPGEDWWLVEYQRILLIAAEDFLRRGRLPGKPEGVLYRLTAAMTDPRQSVWLVLDPAYRLIGFAWVTTSSPFGGPPVAFAQAVYLYPKRRTAEVFPELVRRMVAWSKAQGCEHAYFETRRHRPRAWARIHGRPASVIYEVEMGEPHGLG